ncbi:winged helix-turn-helix domain-containing protein [Saccharopolyspora sp. NPDC047091]|uniref:ArsR/SmtB family transcription factor n=1 Tax=Saccharopolyspora sp. NPDC047091 TaxID=3155924 RepID=UPI003407708A
MQDVHKTTAAVHEFGRTAVQPYWQRLSVLLEIERSARGQAVLDDGIEGLLRSLHATATWEPPFLQIAGRPARKIFLDSAGLVITPSVFLFDRPTLLFSSTDPHSTPVLVYPAPLDVNTKRLWARSTSGGKTLGALLGRTRAEALHALLDSYTTGGLGQRLGISAAAASQHTSVLRNAGLITTRRQKNAVSHSLTPLGLALLNGDGFAEQQT